MLIQTKNIMIKKSYILLLIATLLLTPGAFAQSKKKAKKKNKKVEVIQEDPRITQMLTATQRIMFIDSMVVNFSDFMNYIPLSKECGQIQQNDSAGLFTNELKDLRFMALFNEKDSAFHINESRLIAEEWTEPSIINGLDNASANFPFLMPDGNTLYFAQKGEKSIGGYDLFVTRYDNESNSFLRPDNLGMPFSSEANDYLYLIDEINDLGYFVTDRRQPAGKVCIYIFKPNESRHIYDSETYTPEQIRSFARIDSISATWTDNSLKNKTVRRYKQVKAQHQAKDQMYETAKTQQTPLDNLRHQAIVLEKALQLSRNYYARASESDRRTLHDEILKSERELEALQLEIHQQEKTLRNKQYQQTNH